MATREGIRAALEKVVLEIANAAGVDIQFTDDMRPMHEIPKFDSLVAEDAVMSVSDEIGIEIEDPVFYVGNRVLTFSQILDRLLELTKDRLVP